MNTVDEIYMRRALNLAAHGLGNVSPNPMVGAVIVADNRIIGEGWHRKYGEGHAEVNAVASVKPEDRYLLPTSTMYVTLEPCSHYGKTPPCAELLIREKIKRVVVATVDPFAKVSGRGIAMLQSAGIEVEVGLLGEESRELNRRFMTAHTLKRPFITLKWARSADGFMDWHRCDGEGACRFSNNLTTLSTMRLRSLHDAILTTAATVNADDCRLTVRNWHGKQPRRFVVDRSGKLNLASAMLHDGNGDVTVLSETNLTDLLHRMFADYGVTSVLVEAGPTFLSAMLAESLWDDAREEISDVNLGARGCCVAPVLSSDFIVASELCENNRILTYRNR